MAPALKTYFKVYVALLVLLAATVGAVYVNLGPFNIVITLAIAMAKTLLVVIFFMHIRTSSRTIWIYAILGLAWIGLMLGGTFADVLTRG